MPSCSLRPSQPDRSDDELEAVFAASLAGHAGQFRGLAITLADEGLTLACERAKRQPCEVCGRQSTPVLLGHLSNRVPPTEGKGSLSMISETLQVNWSSN